MTDVRFGEALCFTSFDKFKSEVAQRTRKALQQQQQQSSIPVQAPNPSGTEARAKSQHERVTPDAPDSRQEDVDESGRAKSFRSEASSRDPIPLHERVPDRLKHVPKPGQAGGEIKRTAQVAPISQRLLQMMPSKARSVILYPNDGQYNKPGVRVLLPDTMDLLLDLAVQKLDLPAAARTIFRSEDGSVITNIEDIVDDESLVFSCKEPFKPLQDSEARVRPKTSLPVKTNNG